MARLAHRAAGPVKQHWTRGTARMGATLDHSLLFLLHRAAQIADDALSREIRDLTARQFVVLQAIGDADGISQADLVARTGVDRSTMTDIVRRLQEKGLLSRRRNKADLRAYAVRLTESGARCLSAAAAAAERVNGELASGLTGEQVSQLVHALQALCKRSHSERGDSRSVD